MSTNDSPITTDDADHDNMEPYALHHVREIAARLRKLADLRTTLTLFVDSSHALPKTITTTILDVDARDGSLVLDTGTSEQNAAILASSFCSFQASPEGVQIRFVTSRLIETSFEDRPAFKVEFPDVLYYIQRREFYRVQGPITRPYVCRGTLPDGTVFEYEVHDLSVGGLGLHTFDPLAAKLEIDTDLGEVEVDLLNGAKLKLCIALVRSRIVGLVNDKTRYHLGVRIYRFLGPSEQLLQRHITELELRRNSFNRN